MSFFSIVHINVGLWVSKKTGITQKYSNSNLSIVLLLTDFLHLYFGDGYKVTLTLVGYLNDQKITGVYSDIFVERDM